MSLAATEPMARCTSLAVPYVREHSRMLVVFVATAFFWMLAPGTLLAVVALAGVPFPGHASYGWIQAHAHAQLFGWAGTLILGVSLYAIPRLRHVPISSFLQTIIWFIWTAGAAARWCAAMRGVHDLLLLSAVLELAAGTAAFLAVLAPRRKGERSESLDLVVIAACGFAGALIVNLLAAIAAHHYAIALIPANWNRLAIAAFLWGAIIPTIFAYTVRWVAPMLTLRRTVRPLALLAICGMIVAIAIADSSSTLSVMTRLICTVGFVTALRIFEPFEKTPKTRGVSPATPFFVRLAFVWLIVAAGLEAIAATHAPTLLNAAKHALALGFVASMMLVVAPRFLPAFFGAKQLFSPEMMTLSLVMHHLAVTFRVAAEAGVISERQRVLLVTGSVELIAFALLAANIALTLVATRKARPSQLAAASSA